MKGQEEQALLSLLAMPVKKGRPSRHAAARKQQEAEPIRTRALGKEIIRPSGHAVQQKDINPVNRAKEDVGRGPEPTNLASEEERLARAEN